jgi:hypothetical protein
MLTLMRRILVCAIDSRSHDLAHEGSGPYVIISKTRALADETVSPLAVKLARCGEFAFETPAVSVIPYAACPA